jgi:hypothetical protein
MLISTSIPPREVEASFFCDFFGGLFTFLTAPILLVAPDNPTLRKNNPIRKKVWEEEEEEERFNKRISSHRKLWEERLEELEKEQRKRELRKKLTKWEKECSEEYHEDGTIEQQLTYWKLRLKKNRTAEKLAELEQNEETKNEAKKDLEIVKQQRTKWQKAQEQRKHIDFEGSIKDWVNIQTFMTTDPNKFKGKDTTSVSIDNITTSVVNKVIELLKKQEEDKANEDKLDLERDALKIAKLSKAIAVLEKNPAAIEEAQKNIDTITGKIKELGGNIPRYKPSPTPRRPVRKH